MLELEGQHLSINEIARLARGQGRVALSEHARNLMETSRGAVERIISESRVIYGVNTGFGKLSDVHIPPEDLRDLQVNLVRSTSCGIGSALSEEETRTMMLLRANVLAKGLSGARPQVADTLLLMLQRGVHPVIPEKGSVGASGDLAPLAHLALCVIGEGEAIYRNEKLPGAEALSRAGIEPIELEAKEGLALLNGTQAMTAVGALALYRAEKVPRIADAAGAMTLETLRGTPTAFDERIHAARPHRGQIEVATHLRELLRDSEIRASHLETIRAFRTLTLCAACRRFMALCAALFVMRVKSWRLKPAQRQTIRSSSLTLEKSFLAAISMVRPSPYASTMPQSL